MNCHHTAMEHGDKFCPTCGLDRAAVDRGEIGFVSSDVDFPALRLMSRILRIVAWVGVALWSTVALVFLILSFLPSRPGGYPLYATSAVFGFALVLGFFSWLYTMIQAELIQLMIAIEANTRLVASRASKTAP